MNGCRTCGKSLSNRNRTGWCRQHYAAANNGGPEWSEKNRIRWHDTTQRDSILSAFRRYNATRLDWCPLEYRAEYNRLKRNLHFPANEARHIIEGMIASDLKLYLRTGRLPQTERMAA